MADFVAQLLGNWRRHGNHFASRSWGVVPMLLTKYELHWTSQY